MTAILADESKQQGARQLAGLWVKNSLTATSKAVLDEKLMAWRKLAPQVRHEIKTASLRTLDSGSAAARRAGSQVMATIGAASEMSFHMSRAVSPWS